MNRAELIGQEVVDGVGDLLSNVVEIHPAGRRIDLGERNYRQQLWWGDAFQAMNFPATVRIAIHSEVGWLPENVLNVAGDVVDGLLEHSRYSLFGGLTKQGDGPICIAGAATTYDGDPLQNGTIQSLLFWALGGHAATRLRLYESPAGEWMRQYSGEADQMQALSSAFFEKIRLAEAADTDAEWPELIAKLETAFRPRRYETVEAGDHRFIAEIQTPDGPVLFTLVDRAEHPQVPGCRLATLRLPYQASNPVSAWSVVSALNYANQQAREVTLALGSWAASPDDGFHFTFHQWMPRSMFDVELACSACISMANRGRDSRKLRSLIGTQ